MKPDVDGKCPVLWVNSCSTLPKLSGAALCSHPFQPDTVWGNRNKNNTMSNSKLHCYTYVLHHEDADIFFSSAFYLPLHFSRGLFNSMHNFIVVLFIRTTEHQRMLKPDAGVRQLEVCHHDAGQRSAAPRPQHSAARVWQVKRNIHARVASCF